MIFRASLALLAVFFAAGIGAQESATLTAKAINDSCLSRNIQTETHCLAYMQGVAAGLLGAKQVEVCIPAGTAPDGLAKALGSWLQGHPQHNYLDAGPVVVFAFSKAFPCP